MTFTHRMVLVASAALSILMSASNAQAKDETLRSLSKWLVDWSKDSCVLARKFGSEKEPVLLSMRTYTPGYYFQFTIAGRQIDAFADRADLSLGFGSTASHTVRPQRGTADGYGPAIIFSTSMGPDDGNEHKGDAHVQPYPDAAFEKTVDRVVLATRSKRLLFETGLMAPAMNALRTCTDDLVKQLGLDPEQQHGLSRPAHAANLDDVARTIQADYPATLIAQRKGGRITVRVIVDKAGKATRCDAFQAFSNTDFRIRACDIIMRKAIFEPALDKLGQPAASLYSTTIIYQLG